MSLGQILQAVDSEVDKDTPEGTAATTSPQPTAASQELIKEIESLRAENDALRGQLSLEIQELRKENTELKEKLRESPTSTTLLVNAAPESQPQCQQSKSYSPESISDVSDATVKRFNSLPKSITEFFEQMKNGCEDFPKFTEISDDLRKCKRTKASYSKRKAIYAFINGYTVMVLRRV
jgi:uncharacterized coiled-coil DUF342 family protein